jgi:hypothetical protein
MDVGLEMPHLSMIASAAYCTPSPTNQKALLRDYYSGGG